MRMNLVYSQYRQDESELLQIKELVERFLSEPYSVFCYRYFCSTFPEHCILATDHDTNTLVGVIIGRRTDHRGTPRGYLGMLAVSVECRGMGIGSELIRRMVESMRGLVLEIVLETEVVNAAALKLYEKHGFIRVKLLTHYYMNGSDAFRLKYFFD
jgi:ribosomal protein S18 acetylase RimI-like enzyme